MRKVIAPILLASVLGLGLSGCVFVVGDTTDAQHEMMGHDASGFDANDIMFAQMMIPHHEQAIELSKLAMKNTTTRAILDLAERIKNAQQPEIEEMKGWLDDAGADMEHMGGMDDMGIVGEEDMSSVRKARGAVFDKLFLALMIAHHEGAIQMSQQVLKSTSNELVRALAQKIIDAQEAEIAEMKELLK